MLYRLPPCGGSGLKSCGKQGKSKQDQRLPPCGGSGLKFRVPLYFPGIYGSPSVWREWIEIR